MIDLHTGIYMKYYPYCFKIFLQTNGDYLVSLSLTYADLQLFEVLIAAEEYFTQECFASYPKITVSLNDCFVYEDEFCAFSMKTMPLS